MSTALIWFRQDLRCRDNPALIAACQNHQKLIPLYIKEMNPVLSMGEAQRWWLYHSLSSLRKELNQVHLDLYLREVEPLTLLKELVIHYQVEAVYWNRCYEPMHIARDQRIKAELKSLGIKVISSNGSLLHEPWEICNQNGSYFKVFTPYWRHCLRQMQVNVPEQVSQWPLKQSIDSQSLEEWDLLPSNPNLAGTATSHARREL